MKNFNKFFKRIIATVLSVMIVVSALSGAVSALVSDTDYSISNSEADVTAVLANTAKKASFSSVATLTFSTDLSNYSSRNISQNAKQRLNDGVFDVSADLNTSETQGYIEIPAGKTFAGYGTDYTETDIIWHEDRAMRVIVPLSGTTAVEDIVLALHSSDTLRASKFAVFASTSLETLFDKTNASFYKNVENTGKNRFYDFKFGEGKLEGINYIGLEIYVPDSMTASERTAFINSAGISQYYPRICEFDAYGTVAKQPVTIRAEGENTIPSDLGTSVLKTDAATATMYQNDAVSYNCTATDLANYFDGDITTKAEIMRPSCAFYDNVKNGETITGITKKNAYFDIVLPVKDGYTANKLFISNGNASGDLLTGAYQVYVSDSSATLFTAANLKAEYKNKTNSRRQIITFDESVTKDARFIGIRVTDPIYDASNFITNNPSWNAEYTCVRIGEIGIYGDEIPVATVTADNEKTLTLTDVGTRLPISSAKVTFGTDANACTETGLANIYDNNADTYYAAADTLGLAESTDGALTFKTIADGKYFDLCIGLGKTQKVKAFNLLSVSNDKYLIGSYDIYASKSADTLFDDESKVFSVNANGKVRTAVTLTNEISAKYIGIRTDDVCNKTTVTSADEVYLRIAEFAVWGTDVAKGVVKTIDNNTEPNVKDKNSVVLSSELYVTNATDNNKLTECSQFPEILDGYLSTPAGGVGNDYEMQINAAIFAEGTDNTHDGLTKIVTDGSYHADIVHTLQPNSEIEEIIFAGSSAPMWATSYELYASNTKDNLFTEANRIAVHDNLKADATKTQLYTVSGYTANFVGIRITAVTNSNDITAYSYGKSTFYPRIFEFDVYGSAGEVDTTPESGESIAIPSTASLGKSAKAYFYNGTSRTEVTLKNANLLFDKSIKNAVSTTYATTPFADNANSYLDIVLTLKGSCNINYLYVANALATGMRTAKYSVYIGDSADTAVLFKKPYATFQNTDGDRTQLFSVANKTARYVAIRIFNPVSDTSLTGEDVIATLCEFNALGSVVVADGSDGSTAADMPTGTNILKDQDVVSSMVNTNSGFKGSAGGNLANLTDGDTVTEAMLSDGAAKQEWIHWDEETQTGYCIKDGSVYADITFTLSGTADIDTIYFCNALGGPTTKTGELYVYASSELSNITDFEIAHIDNTVAMQDAFTITFSEKLTGIRYLKFRITNPISTDEYSTGTMQITAENKGVNIYPRIREIVATGDWHPDPFVFKKVYKSTTSNLPTGIDLTGLNNLSTKIAAKAKYGKVRGGELTSYTPGATNHEKDTDGNLKTHYDVAAGFAEVNGTKATYFVDNTSDDYNYFDMYYKLGSKANIDKLVVGSYDGYLCLGKYDVFISNDFASLYSGTPYVTIDNVSEFAGKGAQPVNVICFEEGTTAEFIGIRIYNPMACPLGDSSKYPNAVAGPGNVIYPRITEFSVYGDYVDSTFDPSSLPDPTPPTVTDEEMKNADTLFGKDLLKADNIEIFSSGKKYSTREPINRFKSLMRGENYVTASDKPYYKHVDFSELHGNIGQFVFKLTDYDYTQIDGFIFQGISGDYNAHYTSEYKVFVADDLEDIFLEENMIYHFDPVGQDYTCTKNQKVDSSMFLKEAKGSYIAFQIDKPYYTATDTGNYYPRISFIHAWGKEAVITPVPANMLENMPVTAQFVNGNKYTNISESNLTPKGLKNMTDATTKTGKDGINYYYSNLNTYGTINTKGADRNTLSLTFNLCGDIDVQSLAISTLINSNTGFKTMKVYGASTVSEVNEESALIWTYNVGNKTGKINPSKTISKNMRYVRFVFTGTKEKVQFYTLDVIGPDNQKMKTRTVSNSIALNDVEYFATTKNSDGKAVRSNFSKIHDDVTTSFLDGSDQTWANFGYGYVGETTYDILIYLGDLRTISCLKFMLPYSHKEYWAKKINVYLGESSEVLDATTPDYALTPSDFKQDKAAGIFEKDIRPSLARYIRIQLTDFPKLDIYRDIENNKYNIASFLPDLKLTGTKVKGLQPDIDNQTLYTLYDKATGVHVGISKMDTNDVYDTVTSIKVKKSTATNWQMRSVQAATMMVIGKSVYEIELYDFYGNKVTELGGRFISVGYDTPSEFTDALLVADASVRTTLTGLDSNQTGKVTWSANTEFKTINNKFAFLGITTATDPYWDTIGELENFAEGDLGKLNIVNGVIRTEEWFDSLHTFTESGADKVTMKPVNGTFEPGVKLVTTDISSTATDDEYYNILSYADGKKVAAFYNLALTYQGDDYALNGETVDVNLLLSDYVKNNYTDLQIFQTLADGTVVELWSQNDGTNLEFQTNTMGNIAIIGTALDGSSSVGIGGANGEYGEGGDFTSPATGETATTAAATILVLLAAGFVVATSIRRGLKNR